MQSIVAERRTYSQRVDTHSHSYGQLLLPLGGQLHLQLPQTEVRLDESRLLYLAPRCLHTFSAQATNQFLVVDLPSTLVATVPPATSWLQPLDQRWRALRTLLLAEVDCPSAGLQYLVHYLAEQLQPATPPSIAHIYAHYDRPLTLAELAAIEGYSVPYFCQWFRQRTGCAAIAYLQQVRLTKAQELLTHSDLSVLDIALAVGYDHAASLHRLFRQRLSCTPRQYRQRSRLVT